MAKFVGETVGRIHHPLLGMASLGSVTQNQGTLNEEESSARLTDLLIKEACFVKKVNNMHNLKRSWSKIVSTRRSTVLSIPLQSGFPAQLGSFLFVACSQVRHYSAQYCSFLTNLANVNEPLCTIFLFIMNILSFMTLLLNSQLHRNCKIRLAFIRRVNWP